MIEAASQRSFQTDTEDWKISTAKTPCYDLFNLLTFHSAMPPIPFLGASAPGARALAV